MTLNHMPYLASRTRIFFLGFKSCMSQQLTTIEGKRGALPFMVELFDPTNFHSSSQYTHIYVYLYFLVLARCLGHYLSLRAWRYDLAKVCNESFVLELSKCWTLEDDENDSFKI